MKITPEEVRATAALARLALSDEEVARLCREMSSVLEYMESLARLDVEGVPPMTHAVEMSAPLREDRPGPQLSVDEALSGAPRPVEHFFEVPRVVAHDKEG